MESREEEKCQGTTRKRGEERKQEPSSALSKDPEFGWFGWEGGKPRNQTRTVACSQDPGSEEDFQKQGLFCFVFLRNERVAPGAEFEIKRCNSGLGFGEQKVCFCHVTWPALSLG